MPFSIEWKKNGVYSRFYGNVVKKDLMDFNDLLYADSRFSEISYQIADHTDMSELSMTERDIKIIGTMDKSASPWNLEMKIAVVTIHPEMIKLANVYSENLIGTKWVVKIFSKLEDAKKWVKV